LLLDEIATAELALQEKLLRVLEDGEIMPLGAGRNRKVDVRVLAATDGDLDAMVESGRFSHALLERFGFRVPVPPR
jgi:transcriptional regulator with GAF, ATPase, and Fis domain